MPAAASSSAPAATPAAALLAPGFRFHPTDEELVSYYLRRRVCGRALRVDAIAEVELYKCEPWELPGLSRLRSRDLEWYFFSPLDRKYSSRSRTNRATAQGYWKTTGKDRDVSCGARVVGMKKTLVYHSGRAPRGTRTNWVMHEYRLEDSQLAKSGTPQDAYVVCRVFQKNGAGPQNGAQYGAPFVEEEWEEQETANGVVLMPEAEDDDAVDAHDQEYLEFNDLLQDQIEQEMFVQQDSAVLDTNRQGNDNDPENPTIVLDEILKDPSFMDDVFAYINQSKVQSGPTIVDDSGEQILLKNLSHNDPSQTNDFVELNDSENAINKNWNSNKRYANFVTGEGENSQLYKRIEAELLDSAYHCSDQHKFLQDVQVEDDLSMQTSNLPILADRYGVDPQDQDLIFYDAFYPSKAESSFEFSDEIDKYFDAMENDLPYDNISISENSEQTNPSSLHHSNIKVEGGKSLTDKAITELLHTNIGAGAVSALPVSDYEFKNKYEAIPALPDVVANKDSNTTIRSLLTNMLGSISGPPALAAEAHTSFGKYVGQMSGTYQVNELHVSPAMIHLQNTLQENGNAGLLLSYSLPDNNAGRKTSGLRPFRKIHELAVSLLLRGGCYPLFLSAFVLTVSYKVGMFIYDKN